MYFINELKKRNATLFWFGLFNILAAAICVVLILTTQVKVNGVNAFIKPFKFFFSISMFAWTMGWIMFYLDMPRKIKAYNLMLIIVMVYESAVITWQAANGRLSHFNLTSPLYILLFSLMGIAITVLTAWTGYIGFLFFRKKNWQLPMAYVWGLRLGLLLFVIFAFEGGLMASAMCHTVGGPDNGNGLPLLNWNRQHGDLRIAHFLGMHSLQALPLFGYYLSKKSTATIAFASIYFLVVIAVLAEALMGLPLV